MRIDVVTIFPGYLAALREALLGRAISAGLISVQVHDLRDWTHDVHKAVDDAPYGGGPGMVMRPAVWGAALDAVCAPPEAASKPESGSAARKSTGPGQGSTVPSGAPASAGDCAGPAGPAARSSSPWPQPAR